MTAVPLLDLCSAIVVFVAVGYAVMALFAPRLRLSWFERSALAFPLGVGALSLAWIVLTPLYAVVPAIWVLSASAGAICFVAARRQTGDAHFVGAMQRFPNKGLIGVGSILLVLEFGVMFVAALHTSLGWDGLFNFELKARLAFDHPHPGQLPLAYFSDSSRAWSHPRYPLLVPFAEFWVYSWLGHVDQVLIKVLFPLFFIALVGIVCGTVRRLTSAGIALACGVALGLLPAFTAGYGAISGDADVPLAASIAGAISCGILALQTSDSGLFFLAALFSAAAAWTKVEGIVVALCVGVGVFVAEIAIPRRTARQKVPLLAAASMVWLPLLVMLPWWILQHRYGMPEPDFPSLSPRLALLNIHRFPMMAGLVLRELLTPGHWGLIWPVFAATIALAVWRRDWNAVESVLAAAAIVPLLVYTGAYLFSSWVNVADHVRTSIERLVIPLAPTALVFSVVRLWRDITADESSCP